MTIPPLAVDVMGGDKGPGVVIQGVIDAHREYGQRFLLFGDEPTIRDEIAGRGAAGNNEIEVRHAPDVITMSDSPVEAVREKKNSSLVLAARAVRDGEAGALVSAGNTGASLAAGTLLLGRIKGVERPGIATVLPTKTAHSVLIDVGANVDCRPGHLVHFGIMGAIYARAILSIAMPRVGLLSIGEERAKGNELTHATAPLFERLFEQPASKQLGVYLGNVEGRDIVNGKADVIVCDGFVGNVVLKFGESLAFTIFDLMKARITATPIRSAATFVLKGGFRELMKRIDHTEYGGAPLLGVRHPCIICHGSAGPKAIKNAVRVARESIHADVCARIEAVIKELGEVQE